MILGYIKTGNYSLLDIIPFQLNPIQSNNLQHLSFSLKANLQPFYKMVATKYLFAGLASLSLALAGGASDIQSSIDDIQKSIGTLGSTLKGFNSDGNTMGTALKLEGQAKDLLKEIKDGKETASKVDTLSSSDSDRLEDTVDSLSKSVYSLLDSFVDKKPVFQKAILGGSADGIVDQDLKDLKEATDDFGKALEKIVTGDLKKDAPQILSGLDKHFDDAIKAFSS